MNRHTTTHPDTGRVATRGSVSRVYTHAIWFREPASLVRQSLEGTVVSATAQAERLREAANGEGIAYAQAVARRDEAKAAGRSYVPQVPDAQEYQEYADAAAERAADAQAQLDAGVTDGPWRVEGWAGRLDLAEKRAASLRSKGYQALITEAVVA